MGCIVVLRSPIRSASQYGKVMFAELKHFLIYQADRLEYKELGVVTDTECSNLRIMVHRQRKAFRYILRNRVADALLEHNDVDKELRFVICLVLRGHLR
jgi:hypothetical protein